MKAINQNEFMSKTKHRNICVVLNHTEHLLILTSVVTGCISFSAFIFLVGISIGIATSAVQLKIYAITAGIKTYK